VCAVYLGKDLINGHLQGREVAFAVAFDETEKPTSKSNKPLKRRNLQKACWRGQPTDGRLCVFFHKVWFAFLLRRL